MILLSENSVYLIRNACLCSFTISDCHDPVEPTILLGAGLEIRGRTDDHYLPLPSKFDIHEYRIMERFCYAVDDDEMRDDLFNAIQGRGAFRRFKDSIHKHGVADDWYKHRDDALKEIAIAWCEENGMQYTE